MTKATCLRWMATAFLCLALPARATDYTVKKAGGAAFTTIGAAYAAALANISGSHRVLIQDSDVYNEIVNATATGTVGVKITIEPEGANTPSVYAIRLEDDRADVTIRRLLFDGTLQAKTTSYLLNVYDQPAGTLAGKYMLDACTVRGLSATDPTVNFKVSKNGRMEIRNCTFEVDSSVGGGFALGSMHTTNAMIVIHGNRFKTNRNLKPALDLSNGKLGNATCSVMVEHNIFEKNRGGIAIRPQDVFLPALTIRNNTFYRSGDDYKWLEGALWIEDATGAANKNLLGAKIADNLFYGDLASSAAYKGICTSVPVVDADLDHNGFYSMTAGGFGGEPLAMVTNFTHNLRIHWKSVPELNTHFASASGNVLGGSNPFVNDLIGNFALKPGCWATTAATDGGPIGAAPDGVPSEPEPSAGDLVITVGSDGSAGVDLPTAFSVVATSTSGTPSLFLDNLAILPSGITFANPGGGVGTFAWPSPQAGQWTLNFSATTGVYRASTNFVLSVTRRTGGMFITVGSDGLAEEGVPLEFPVIATSTNGTPALALDNIGSLPSGIAFTDAGNGVGTFAWPSPAVGQWTLVFAASAGPYRVTNSISLTVAAAPPAIVISVESDGLAREGQPLEFPVVATSPHGTPTLALDNIGSLPSGIAFSNEGNGAGRFVWPSPAVGQWSLIFSATTGVYQASTSFLLNVLTTNVPPPTVEGAVVIVVGSPGATEDGFRTEFPVIAYATNGTPVLALSNLSELPAGITFTNEGVGLARFTWPSPPIGQWPLVFTATIPGFATTTNFLLSVADHGYPPENAGPMIMPAFPPPANATVIHASLTGLAGNAGTSNSPVTVAEALIRARTALPAATAPVYVLFKRGDYWTSTGAFVFSSDLKGYPTRPLVFGAYGIGAAPRLARLFSQKNIEYLHFQDLQIDLIEIYGNKYHASTTEVYPDSDMPVLLLDERLRVQRLRFHQCSAQDGAWRFRNTVHNGGRGSRAPESNNWWGGGPLAGMIRDIEISHCSFSHMYASNTPDALNMNCLDRGAWVHDNVFWDSKEEHLDIGGGTGHLVERNFGIGSIQNNGIKLHSQASHLTFSTVRSNTVLYAGGWYPNAAGRVSTLGNGFVGANLIGCHIYGNNLISRYSAALGDDNRTDDRRYYGTFAGNLIEDNIFAGTLQTLGLLRNTANQITYRNSFRNNRYRCWPDDVKLARFWNVGTPAAPAVGPPDIRRTSWYHWTNLPVVNETYFDSLDSVFVAPYNPANPNTALDLNNAGDWTRLEAISPATVWKNATLIMIL